MIQDLVGNIIEKDFLSWNHFIPFPRGYIFWTAGEKKSIFLQVKRMDHAPVESTGHIICDLGNFTTESGYSQSTLETFMKKNKGPAIEIRTREASVLTRESMIFLFQRHNGFVHKLTDDMVSEALLYLSCMYGWDKNAEVPKGLEIFQKNGFLGYDEIVGHVQNEPFMLNVSFEMDLGAVWKDNCLGPFVIFKSDDYWHIAHKNLRKVMMRNFSYKMDAMLHAESLFSFYRRAEWKDWLDLPISELDFFHLDTFSLEKPVLYSYD